jgi:serine beta-lactamase-like protein LACTB, mitochondrial
VTDAPTRRRMRAPLWPAKPFARVSACALLLSSSAAVANSTAEADAEDSASRISNRILAALIEANGVPGMAASIWRDGEIVWTGSAGYRDTENRLPVDKDTVFRLASVSKLVAATAAAKLREQGKLDVDQTVQSILDYPDAKWSPMTTRQLAAHTAGIPHYQTMDEGRGGRRFANVREAVGVFSHRDLISAPGAAYNYSSYGYTLLSAVVEQSAGKPYLEFVADAVVAGLEIGPDVTGQGNPAASKAYDYESGALRPAAPHDFSYSWAGAGMSATAGDLARFGGRLLSGEIVAPATFEWMLEPARLADGTIVTDGDSTVGFGWRAGKDNDGERIAHHAGVAIGARSALIVYPDREFAVSLLSNAPWVSSIEQTAMTLSAPFRAAAKDAPVRACPLNATRYEGEFDGKAVTGTARFSVQDGICSGAITVGDALGAWLNGFPQKDAQTIGMIGLDTTGGFSRAALVTPIGAYDLRGRDEDGRYVARFGGSRLLSLAFQ